MINIGSVWEYKNKIILSEEEDEWRKIVVKEVKPECPQSQSVVYYLSLAGQEWEAPEEVFLEHYHEI